MPVPAATVSIASLLVHRRPLELVGLGSPAARVGSYELLVDEVGRRDLLVRGGEHVVAGGDGDLQLVVEADAVQPVAVDGQSDDRHVEAAVAHAVDLLGLGQRHQVERLPASRSRQLRAHLSGVAPVTKPTRRGAIMERA